MPTFRLLGRNPVRFTYDDGLLEANFTLSPDDGDDVLRDKLRRMLQFLDERNAPPVQSVPLGEIFAPAVAKAPELPESSRANGWETYSPDDLDEA